MSDVIMTQEQVENLFQSLTSTILNTTDPSAVRINWPEDGAPSFAVTEDVCFIAVLPMDNPYGHQVQNDLSAYDANNANVAMTYTDGIRVQWVLYGPSAFDRAGLIWSGLFLDSTHDTLIANNIPLVTDVAKPIRAPENRNGQWFNRVSLYAQFNELVIRNSQLPYITSAPVTVVEG